MAVFLVAGLLLPLCVGGYRHVVVLVLQILFERISVSLELNAAAAYAAPLVLTAYRVSQCVAWFLSADSYAAAVAALNVVLWTFNLIFTLLISNVLVLLKERVSPTKKEKT
mmetsp:Transcript_25426/g.82240  ORF Transcript_25426/g.82240 Transcript_25426/m.82240 type:complete len:111 (+) Transcript_25426:175-507(+)